jgi:hypothetical protein
MRSIRLSMVSPTPDLVEAFGALQSLLLRTQGVNDFLVELAGLAAGVVEPPASCGITVRRDGQPLTVASSDALAEQVDEVQYGPIAGPACKRCPPARSWTCPIWAPRRGGRSIGRTRRSRGPVLAVASAGRRRKHGGAMNLYGFTSHAFTSAVRQQAETFAVQAAAGLTLVLRSVLHDEESEQLEQALANRTIIDQALGILNGQAAVHGRGGIRPAAGPVAEQQPQASGGRCRSDYPDHESATRPRCFIRVSVFALAVC